jgi:hypothetical protein
MIMLRCSKAADAMRFRLIGVTRVEAINAIPRFEHLKTV